MSDNGKSVKRAKTDSVKLNDIVISGTDEISFLSLNNHILLLVFSYLSIMDSVKLGDSCVRLQQLCANIVRQKFNNFNVTEYVNTRNKNVPLETVLSYIGAHIVELSSRVDYDSQISDNIMRRCINIKSLHIDFSGYNHLCEISTWNKWITARQLESLCLSDARIINNLCDGVTTLKELKVGCSQPTTAFWRFIGSNPHMESLYIYYTGSNFLYNIFDGGFQYLQLQDLRHLEWPVHSTRQIRPILEKWRTLETLRIPYPKYDKILEFLDENWIMGILGLSTKRPTLRLHFDKTICFAEGHKPRSGIEVNATRAKIIYNLH